MSEFTKGPWLTRHLVDEDGDYDISSWDIHAFPYGKESGQQGICYGITRLQDANLISASPLMFDVIKHIATDGAEITRELRNAAKQIVAKAKGE
jgi:hypothetical protein